MKSKFTDIFIQRPVLATVLSLLILFVGLISIHKMQLRQWPYLTLTTIEITTAYPGANAQVVQGFVTNPMQKLVASAEGIDYMTSSSTLGVSKINCHIKIGYDPERAFTDISAKVAEAEQKISQNAQKPVIKKMTGSQTAALYLNATSSNMNPMQITDYLNRVVVPVIQSIQGVSDVAPYGYQYSMQILLKPNQMAAYNISPAEVWNVLKQNNLQAAGGATKGKYLTISLNPQTDLHTAAQFKNLIIKSQGTQIVRLQDIAKVELGPANDNISTYTGNKVTVIEPINLLPTANPLTVVDAYYKLLPQLRKHFPAGFHLTTGYDSSKFIRASIHEIFETIFITTVIVIIVIFLFLGSLRTVAIPVIAIPLSLFGVGTLMLALDFSINTLTLLAMVLAIGMVVDDAIVVVENIYRHIEHGEKPFSAAMHGAREIASPVITMSITLVAVYAPIGLLGGMTGELFTEFAFTLAGTIIISAIIALTLSPMLCSKVLNEGLMQAPLVQKVDAFFIKLKAAYKNKLHKTLNYRPVTIFMAIIILLSCVAFYLFIPKQMAPQEDQGVVIVSATAPEYSNIDYLYHFSRLINPILLSFPAVTTTFGLNNITGNHQALNFGVLKDWHKRTTTQKQIFEALQPILNTKIAGLQSYAGQLPPLPTSGSLFPFQFELKSTGDYKTLYKYAEKLTEIANKSGKFFIAINSLKLNRPQIDVKINRNKAASLGITMSDISDSLSASYSGGYVNYFSRYGWSYQVIPKLERIYRQNPQQLEHIYIKTKQGTGKLIPLSSLVTIKETIQPNELDQFQQLNNAEIGGIYMPPTTEGQALTYMKKQAAKILPKYISVDYAGQLRQFIQGGSLVMTFVFALLVIYLVLAAQFESFRDPFIILFSVPLSISGALLPLFLGGGTINIYTQIGLITLIGLISKHGILIVEFANKLRDENDMSIKEAIVEAASVRLRPVLMTTAAMVLGVTPLIFASGAGAHARNQIGLVIACGMLIGTMFTLFVVPAVYSYLTRPQRQAIQLVE